jgi:eukaryotic-like serine/threonine-protein kinase
MTASAERSFGPYRLVHQIATGGMAELHLALTRGIGGFEKYVALKMIHPNFSSDDHFIEMLVDEAKITVQLQHANIGQIFDLGRVGDTYYIAMEYVDGCDLYKLLRRAAEKDRPFPVEIAAYICKEVCSGLDHAHRKRDMDGRPLGIIHRDISPQNVLISTSGEVKVVDFGIAKATMRARQTRAGVIKGKYYYMSPEQASGEPLDARTDIFSAGILLHEMLTGQMLYWQEDVQRLLEMVRRADIAPPSANRKGVPPELDRMAMRALSRKVGGRWQTAYDFAAALERFLHGYAPGFSPSRLAAFVAEVNPPAPPPAAVPVAAPVPAARVTAMGRESILRSRAEFTDENSMIFPLSDVGKRRSGAESTLVSRSTKPAAASTPAAVKPKPKPALRSPGQATTPAGRVPILDDPTQVTTLPDDGEDSGDRTMVGPHPDFGTVDEERTAPKQAAPPGEGTIDLEEWELEEQNTLPGPKRATRKKTPQTIDSIVPPTEILRGGNPSPALSALRGERPTRRRKTPAAVPATRPEPAPRAEPRPTPSGLPLAAPREKPSPTWPPEPWSAERSATGPVGLSPEESLSGYRLKRISPRGASRWPWIIALVAAVVGIVAAGVALLIKPGTTPAARGSIEVISIPPGGKLHVDGKWVGTTPAAVSELPVGSKVSLRVELERHEPWERVEEITAGRHVKVIASLRRVYGTLVVASEPMGAEVFLDNASIGVTPLERADMDPFVAGTIEVRKRGYKPQRQTLTWTAQRSATLRFILEPARE